MLKFKYTVLLTLYLMKCKNFQLHQLSCLLKPILEVAVEFKNYFFFFLLSRKWICTFLKKSFLRYHRRSRNSRISATFQSQEAFKGNYKVEIFIFCRYPLYIHALCILFYILCYVYLKLSENRNLNRNCQWFPSSLGTNSWTNLYCWFWSLETFWP